MEPTPRALALIPAARDVLARIQQGIVETGAFDPATTTHLFSIALSDVGEMVFLPRIVEAMARQAPHASVQSVTLPPAQIERALETGALDLAVGYFPDLKKNNFFQQRLFTHYFTCIVRADHPVTRGGNTRLSMQQFLEYGHAVVRAEGRSQELYERFLERKRIRRKPALLTPHFMSIPFILARTDLIATVPHAVGLSFMQSHANIRVMEPRSRCPASTSSSTGTASSTTMRAASGCGRWCRRCSTMRRTSGASPVISRRGAGRRNKAALRWRRITVR